MRFRRGWEETEEVKERLGILHGWMGEVGRWAFGIGCSNETKVRYMMKLGAMDLDRHDW